MEQSSGSQQLHAESAWQLFACVQTEASGNTYKYGGLSLLCPEKIP
jgi:hypothetical protein